MEKAFIEKYFENVQTNLKKHLENLNLEEVERVKIHLRLDILNELRQKIEWQEQTSSTKQKQRIQSLGTMRKLQALKAIITKQETAIKIYELIKITVPYLEVINSSGICDSILNFCNGFSDKIDFAGATYRGDFPNENEIEKLFAPYFDIIKPSQGNGGMFKECYEKIEILHDELKAISDIF